VVKWNDVICEGQLDLYEWFMEAYKRKETVKPFLEERAMKEAQELEAQGVHVEFDFDEGSTGEADSLLGGGGSKAKVHPGEGDKKGKGKSKGKSKGKGAAKSMKDAIEKAKRARAGGGSSSGAGEKDPTKADEDHNNQQANQVLKQLKDFAGVGDIAEDADWIQLYAKDESGAQKEGGALCCTIQIVPENECRVRPNGLGREEPNCNPFCPPPVGRMEFTVNPIYMLRQLCGPEIFYKFCCCFGCLTCFILSAVLGSILTPWIVLLKR
jgi:hypothetical protein